VSLAALRVCIIVACCVVSSDHVTVVAVEKSSGEHALCQVWLFVTVVVETGDRRRGRRTLAVGAATYLPGQVEERTIWSNHRQTRCKP
jgi:hypothetical protein